MDGMYSYSTRFNWNAEAHPLWELLQRRLKRNDALIDLTDANPTRAAFDAAIDAAAAALQDQAPRIYTPVPRGLPEAREAVARYYARGRPMPPPPRRS